MIGLVGLGAIGQRVRAHAPGDGQTRDRWVTTLRRRTAGWRRAADLSHDLARVRRPSLHRPLTADNNARVDQRADAGGLQARRDHRQHRTRRLIDEAALLAAIRSGQVGRRADSFATEPMTAPHPFQWRAAHHAELGIIGGVTSDAYEDGVARRAKCTGCAQRLT